MDKMHKEEIATGYELKAIKLENFIKNYIPSGWKEPIGKVMSGFSFFEEDIIEMEEDFKRGEGVLKDKINEKYKNPNVVQAILDFFKNQ